MAPLTSESELSYYFYYLNTGTILANVYIYAVLSLNINKRL